MRSKALLVGAFLAFASMNAASAAPAAAAQSTSAAPDAKVEAFFSALKDGKAAKAYADAFAGTLMTKKQGELELMISQTETMFRYYGPVLDWEMVKDERVSDHYLVRTYMLRTGEMPMFFKFQLYDNGKAWVIANIFMTDTYENSGL